MHLRSFQETIDSLKYARVRTSLPKKTNEGIETGYQYQKNGMHLIVWPTYSGTIGGPKESDQGWILIIDPRNEELFFAIPMRRRKAFKFIERFFASTQAYVELLDKWPKCPVCGNDLYVGSYKKEQGMYAFSCNGIHKNKPWFRITECDFLSPTSQRAIANPFILYQKYLLQNKQKGDFHVPRRLLTFLQRNGIPAPTVYWSDTQYEHFDERNPYPNG
ncbi:hypothetical protein K2Q02_00325 [Patescibacteria group bacterium]|nr:hypothetical protein [Patescibacteria group bacterium]